MANDMDLVIITGMSGAGKTVTMQSFEDLGYFCVDNMPPLLLPKLMELLHNSAEYKRVALVMDARSPEFYKEIVNVLQELDTQGGVQPRIVFLDSSDEELVARYKETRRSHPLAMGGRVLDGIKKERAMLAEMRSRASVVIDTSTISPRQLRERFSRNLLPQKANRSTCRSCRLALSTASRSTRTSSWTSVSYQTRTTSRN